MSTFRSLVGAALGAAVAGAALRVRVIARARNASIADTVVDLPAILADDAAIVADAARGAIQDGRAARVRTEHEIEQVARSGRRTKDHHD